MKEMKIKLMGCDVVVFGGPYADRPEGMFAVKMAEESVASCNVSVPTRDFGVPRDEDLRRGLRRALRHLILEDDRVFVGCAGGLGRTGLFLACLAKVSGQEHPVEYVRSQYDERAVETNDQVEVVRALPTFWLRAWVALLRVIQVVTR